jgi:hypothetical protein
MRLLLHRRVLGLCTAAAMTLVACASASSTPPAPAPAPETQGAKPSTPPAQHVNPDAQTLASLHERVTAYLELHKKIEASLPKLPTEATPEQIDQYQRTLGRRIQDARRHAQPGDIFTKDARGVIRGLMLRVFSGPEGAKLKASVMDENPGRLQLTVNSRYPDSVPLSTVPPQVLAGLPRLAEELEFRFIGRTLILMDSHAHLIVDLIENIIP